VASPVAGTVADADRNWREVETSRVSARPTTYEGIAAELRKRIQDGAYAPGSELPSNAKLRSEFGVADGTIRRALAELDRAGLTVARQGRPRMVTSPGQEMVGTLYERVVRGIRDAIADGRLAPGTSLLSEAEIAAEYGVGRKTVRQALAELERAGDVVNRPGRRRQVPGVEHAHDALYEEIAVRLADDFASGTYSPGVAVPSESALCSQYNVSRATIRKALNELRRKGMVTHENGRTRPTWAAVG
jgi:DNA-binding GntR family transcriptional regulator